MTLLIIAAAISAALALTAVMLQGRTRGAPTSA
jgi:hypothetical protein